MTTPKQPWIDPAGPLKNFMVALGFDASRKFNEWPDKLSFDDPNFLTDRLTLSTDVSARQAQLASLDRVMQDLREKYGTTLTLQLEADPHELSIQDYTPKKLEHFCDKVAGNPFEVHIKLEKKELAAHWGITANTAEFKVFLFPEALARSLQVPLTDLEQGQNALMPAFTGEKKLIILVPDHHIDLDGDYLAVLGGGAVGNWKQYVPARTDEAHAKVARVHKDATAKPKWADITLKHLTPLQLNVGWKKPSNDTAGPPAKDDLVAGPLYSQLMACSLLYLATYAQRLDATTATSGTTAAYEWLATFKEDKYLASIEVGTTAKIGETLIAANANQFWVASQAIGDLVGWAYKEVRGTSIRLALVQAVIASVLQDTKPSENLLELARSASEVSIRIQDRWEAFMDDRLEKYFSSIKALEEAVESTSKTYNEQVQVLTKTLIDSMLAAVGVVVGSFLVAVFKSPFQAHVFRFGTVTYWLYLAIFPIGIGLFTAWKRFKDSKALFEKRKRDFSSRLEPEEVDKIVGQTVSERERKFGLSFRNVTFTYLGILVLMAVAIWQVPALIKQWNDFRLSDVSYGAPMKGTVPIIIRGENFDKDKEIVVGIGNSRFSNTTEPSLKVHGSTILTLSPKRKDLIDAINQGNESVRVRQGGGEERSAPLPADAPPTSPDPVLSVWSWVPKEKGGVAIVTGSNLDSIAEIRLHGMKRDLQVSGDGTTIELPSMSKTEWEIGKVSGVLIDGRTISLAVRFAP